MNTRTAMNTKFDMRSFGLLLACGAIALFGASGQALAAETGNQSTPWVAGSDSEYHTIIDFTQGGSVNVVASNTQSTTRSRQYPYIGSDTDPWAAINPAMYPTGYNPGPPDLYVNVKFDNNDILSSISSATYNTCDQSNASNCPGSGTLPTTYIHRLGNYDSSSGTVTPLANSALPGGAETLNSMFQAGNQAFDVDRIRYVANRLWYEWYHEVTTQSGPWYDAFYKLQPVGGNTPYQTYNTCGMAYQPTGTMSFENFTYNVTHGCAMYGIVRVVIPVETQGGGNKRVGDMYIDPKYPVAGKEFTNPPSWSGTGTRRSQPVMVSYEYLEDPSIVPSGVNISGPTDSKLYPYSGTVKVYGTLLVDYVDSRTYTPNDFLDGNQDYIDAFAATGTQTSQQVHDGTSITGRENVILPRSSGRNIVLMDWDTLDINPIDDLVNQVQYTDTPTAGSDGRMDTLDYARREYMMAGSTNYQSSEISDDYVAEYWMRYAASLGLSDQRRTDIIRDITGNAPGNTGTTPPTTGEFDYQSYITGKASGDEKFTSGAAERANFDNGYQGQGWPSMTEANKFHAYFPSGYEPGWINAFWHLDMAYFDANDTTEKTPGSWWMHLPDDSTAVGGVAVGGGDHAGLSRAYDQFQVPTKSANWITLSLDGGNTQQSMPNFYAATWEDLPAFAFAGGLLDVHGFANISGMLYTPDSMEIEAHALNEVPGGSASGGGPIQYVNGALLVGNGFFLQDQDVNDHSMIAISYNYYSFDNLRKSTASVTITTATNIAELQGQ